MTSRSHVPLALLVLHAVLLAGVTGLVAPGHGHSPSIPASGVTKVSGPHRLSGLRRKAGEAVVEVLEPVRGGGAGSSGGWGGIKLAPATLVATFTMVNMLNYMDRGLVNGVLPHLEEDFQVGFTLHPAYSAMHSCENRNVHVPWPRRCHAARRVAPALRRWCRIRFLLEVPTRAHEPRLECRCRRRRWGCSPGPSWLDTASSPQSLPT